ncbi:MAG: hypothetical protein E7010_00425 [Alphaproteobacteria bacterium]|nr:hypothetical protein [Alphaproteobacteria bacterium]
MSSQTAGSSRSKSNSNLPQFMSEQPTSYSDIEEDKSWLNNNLHKLMVSVSVIWFAVVLVYITQFFGWSNLFLMMPDEFGGFLAGITLPLAIIWVVMAYIDRGTSFKQEAKFLRAYMNQLVYPEDGAPQTAKAMADAIRSQVVELQQVSKAVTEHTAIIKDEMRANISELSKLIATLDTYSSKTIIELSDSVKYISQNFDNITGKAQGSIAVFNEMNRDMSVGASQVESSLDNLFNNLLPRIKELKEAAGFLQEFSNSNNHSMTRANEMLRQLNDDAATNLTNLGEILSTQTSMLQDVSQIAVENCNMIKKSLSKEVENLSSLVDIHSSKLEKSIGSAGEIFRNKIDELGKKAADNIVSIDNQFHKNIHDLDDSVDDQIKKVETVMGKHKHDIIGLMKTLNDNAEEVNGKLSTHGNVLAQEIDKLMVRSSNLEESVATQVSKMSDVSSQIVNAMQQVDAAVENNVNTLRIKSAAATDDLTAYISELQEKTMELDRLSADVIERSAQAGDELISRHKHIKDTMSGVIKQLYELNEQIDVSAENLHKQSENAAHDINEISEVMQKHTASLTEATSVVVAQSQVSETSLAQQQKNITESAARVEEIKGELKRQIDELSSASALLESNATGAVDNLKQNISVMLSSCNDVINKSRAINDNLAEQSNQFDTSANRTLSKVMQFESILNVQNQNMDNLSQLVSDRVANIDEVLTRQHKNINEMTKASQETLTKSMNSFEEQGRSLNDISRSTASYVADIAQGLDAKAASLNILFKQQEDEFFSFCDKIAENAEVMKESLKKQVGIIEQSTDKVFARMVMLEEDTSRHADSVVTNSMQSIDRLNEIEELIAAKNESISKMVGDVSENLYDIMLKLQETINTFGTNAKQLREEATLSSQNILSSCADLSAAQNGLSKETSNVVKLINEHAKNLDISMMKAHTQGEEINQLLSTQAETLTEVANTLATQSRLGESSLAQQYQYLSEAAVQVAEKMHDINEQFKTNTSDVFEMSTKLVYEIDVLGDRLIKAGDMVNKTSKNSMKSMDQVNLTLTQNTEDLELAVRTSIEQLGKVFQEYEKYLAGFTTVTAETSTSVYEINNLITDQSTKMVKISDDTKKLVDCFNTVLNDTSNALAERANDAYDKVKGLGKDLKNLGLQMEEAAKLSATHITNSGDKLRASINEIAANAERISNDIVSSGEVFVKQSQALVASTDDTVTKINTVMGTLLESSKDFGLQGDNLVQQSIHFNDVIGRQIKQLNESTKKADATLELLNSSYKEVKIEHFLKEASNIIEKLQNISIDINRVFNPKDEEDLWKKFYNGDSGIFVRYLSKNMTKQQVSAIRNEFENSNEFRKLITSYLSEFEVLINAAKSHEYSGVLLSVISGAEIGKLYYILAKALDRIN